MKTSKTLFLLLAMVAISVSCGCVQNSGVQSADLSVNAAEVGEEQAISMLEKELDGISDQLGVLGKKAQGLDSSEKTAFDDKLMSLRREIWDARVAATRGEIEDGKKLLSSLKAQIDALM